MRVITANLNGIRSAVKKGFFEWMVKQEADVICLQEIKAQEADLDKLVHPVFFKQLRIKKQPPGTGDFSYPDMSL